MTFKYDCLICSLQLLHTVNSFSDENIKEHLQCVLDNVHAQSRQQPDLPDTLVLDRRAQLLTAELNRPKGMATNIKCMLVTV